MSMLSVVSLVSRFVRRSTPLVASALLACGGSSLFSQAPTPQAQSPAPSTNYDPTRPEIQPSLDLDRDPILSPDAEDNAGVNPSLPVAGDKRSEEHTSELQSLRHLVCRLLLEKK